MSNMATGTGEVVKFVADDKTIRCNRHLMLLIIDSAFFQGPNEDGTQKINVARLLEG